MQAQPRPRALCMVCESPNCKKRAICMDFQLDFPATWIILDWQTPRMGVLIFAALDGGLAAPCNLQTAPAGLNPSLRFIPTGKRQW